MKSFIKIIVSIIVVYITVCYVTGKKVTTPIKNLMPKTSESVKDIEPKTPKNYVLTDKSYDQILSEHEIELILMNLKDKFPINDPQISIYPNGSIEFCFNIDLQKTVEEYKTPTFITTIANLGLVKGSVPLYIKGNLQSYYGKLQFFPQDARIANLSVKSVEDTLGITLLMDNKNINEINKIINETIIKELKVKVSEVDYGTGFVRLKGKVYKDTSEADE